MPNFSKRFRKPFSNSWTPSLRTQVVNPELRVATYGSAIEKSSLDFLFHICVIFVLYGSQAWNNNSNYNNNYNIIRKADIH
jgi:hypothetical protein